MLLLLLFDTHDEPLLRLTSLLLYRGFASSIFHTNRRENVEAGLIQAEQWDHMDGRQVGSLQRTVFISVYRQ